MRKQAIGVFALSHKLRTDTIVHVLDYPQKAIVNTKFSKIMNFDTMPAGINCVVAVACYGGWNQEDSIMLNRSSIDRGLFRSTSYRTISDEERKKGTYSNEIIELPPLHIRKKGLNYNNLDQDGIVEVGVAVVKGDVIIGKCLYKSSKTGEEEKIDCSGYIKSGEEGIVDRVIISTTPNGYKLVKIVIRNSKIPEIGDKFASRSAQKGTCGMIFNQEDMPFSCSGITPDIIINPHCLPSRMTINQLMETVLGKACVMEGTFGDSTPFDGNNDDGNLVYSFCDRLKSVGFEQHGWEELYNGMSGEPLKAKIFMGPTYYQRLKHMVSEKQHSRSSGSVTILTRQPLEGRSREGGLRFGEMERDCMIAHGTSAFLKERLFEMSDPYQVIVCNKCGIIVPSSSYCKGCDEDNVSKVNLPYASKLLIQELQSMSIKIAIKPKLSITNEI
jgi:DNA-directed RNA polymerase II subunit RPB2